MDGLGATLKSALERAWRLIEAIPIAGCWVWVGCRTDRGYGYFAVGGRRVEVARWLYAQMVRVLAPDERLRRLCQVSSCVNPAHGQPFRVKAGDRRSYQRRGIIICRQGHRVRPLAMSVTRLRHRRDYKNNKECRSCRQALFGARRRIMRILSG